MAMVSGMGHGGGQSWMRNDLTDRRDEFRDDEVCSCLPELSRPKAKRSKASLQKERIRQFSIWYFENEDQREGEHVKLRRERQQKATDIANLKWIRRLKMLYILDVLTWIAGIILTLCSSVEVIGKGTPFYEERELYVIIGPLVIFLGVVLLLVATGLKHKLMKGLKQRKQTNFVIMQKGASQCSSTRSRTNETDCLLDIGTIEEGREFAEDVGISLQATSRTVL